MTDEITYCAVHPDRETGLRCNKCDRYMCSQCAVQTPVGYRCRECVRQVEDRFYDALPTDALIAFGVAAAASAVGGLILSSFGGFGLFIALIVGFPLGIFIGGWVIKATGRRKGRDTWRFAVGGVIVGACVGAFIGGMMAYPDSLRVAYETFQQMSPEMRSNIQRQGLTVISQTDFALRRVVSINTLIYAGITAYSAYSRLRG